MTQNREKGFTLLEILLVLSIFLAVSSVSFVLLKPHYHALERELFFSRLKSDLLLGQQYAISHQREITVHIIPEKNYYYIHDRFGGAILVERKYSEAIQVEEGSMKLFFYFLADGNINRFGSFTVRMDGKTYRMTFLIGRGRFYVMKE